MENIEIIYYYEISLTDDITNCYKNIKSQLEHISTYLRNKIHIIIVCNLIEEIEYFSHMINVVLRKGNGIGKNVRCVTYNLYLIENNNKTCFLKTIKNICNKENNINIKYLCINSKFIDINDLNIYIECITNIKNSNPNETDIFTVNYTDNNVPYIFYVCKKYIDNVIHYDEIFIKPKISYLDETMRSSKLEEIDIYTHFDNKYSIQRTNNSDEEYTKLDYSNIISIQVDMNFKKIKNIDNIDSFILVIDFPRLGGGTTYFLSTIIEKYKNTQTFIILRNIGNNMVNISINDEFMLEQNYTYNETINFIECNINKIIKIFVNHIIKHPEYFIEQLFNYEKEVTYITHDYYLLFNCPQPTYKIINEDKNTRYNIFINKFDKIITQNIVNLNIFDKYLNNNKNIILTELPDYKNSKELFETNNENIIIGFVGEISDIKGRDFVLELNNYIRENRLNMSIVIFGFINVSNEHNNIIQKRYKTIDEFNNLLIKYKPNLLIDASIWPETYSYSLSLMMCTKLPILSIKKDDESVIHDRLKKYKNSYIFENVSDCVNIVHKVNQSYFYTVEPVIYFNSFWDNYFNNTDNISLENIDEYEQIISMTDKSINSKIHEIIEPYAIYFPQFHRIPENDILFYEGYTDYINLIKIKNENKLKKNILTPFKGVLNNYDILLNQNLLNKQIELSKRFGIKGFAFYHYWFDYNLFIENNNNIMEKFTEKIIDIIDDDFSYFLIWPNDKWCNELYNEYNYNEYLIEKHFNNLIKYFNDKKYKKVDNKPVFGILHYFIWSKDNFNKYINYLNKRCIDYGFNGIYISSMTQYDMTPTDNSNACYLNVPCWKNASLFGKIYENNGTTYVDYNNYIDDFEKNILDKIQNKDIILNIFPNFDNYVRNYFKKTMTNFSYINTSPNNFEKYLQKLLKLTKIYKNKSKIFLINSWNEWGENMAIEPSNELKYEYLEIIFNNLKSLVNVYEK